ncbi:hypothetical protein VNO77_03115 [Canavalia gladiata]|uniref:Uncharacterized protein n=1 Tax=Canavalia gladiata TaxID=3824 RepID=A0AAN9R7V1_CANGL
MCLTYITLVQLYMLNEKASYQSIPCQRFAPGCWFKQTIAFLGGSQSEDLGCLLQFCLSAGSLKAIIGFYESVTGWNQTLSLWLWIIEISKIVLLTSFELATMVCLKFFDLKTKVSVMMILVKGNEREDCCYALA